MISRLFVSILIGFIAPWAWAKPTTKSFVKSVISKYNSNSGVKAQIHKKVYLALLEETKESEGELAFSKGEMRLELQGSEKTVITMTKGSPWVETAGATSDSKPQVAQVVSKDAAKMSRAPLALVLGQTKAIDHFNVISDEVAPASAKDDKRSAEVRKLVLVPKDLKKYKDLQKLYLEIEPANLVIKTAQYEDELGNRTTFHFADTKFDQKFDKKTFRYSPPKDADVTVYR